MPFFRKNNSLPFLTDLSLHPDLLISGNVATCYKQRFLGLMATSRSLGSSRCYCGTGAAWGHGGRDAFLPPNPGVISWFLNAAIDAFSIIIHVKAACQKH